MAVPLDLFLGLAVVCQDTYQHTAGNACNTYQEKWPCCKQQHLASNVQEVLDIRLVQTGQVYLPLARELSSFQRYHSNIGAHLH